MLRYLTGNCGILLLFNILTGATFAFIIPVMSFFIVSQKGLHVQPLYFLVYVCAITLAGLLSSQWLGRLADRGYSSKLIYLFSMTSQAVAAICYASVDSFWLVLLIGVVFLGLFNAAMPQLLTLSRQFANQAGEDAGQLNSVFRAAFAFGWIIGAPLAFILIDAFGFSQAFYFCALLALITVVLGWWCLPDYQSQQKQSAQQAKAIADKSPVTLSIWLLGGAIVLGNLANSMYLASLAPMVIEELQLAGNLPGIMMALVAALEIPMMVLAAMYAKKHNKLMTLRLGFLVGIGFYISMFYSQQVWQLLLLQVVNAIFFGIFAGLALTIVQDFMQQRIGFASAFYSNALRLGSACGAIGFAVAGQFFTYQYAVLGSALALILALICLFFVRKAHAEA